MPCQVGTEKLAGVPGRESCVNSSAKLSINTRQSGGESKSNIATEYDIAARKEKKQKLGAKIMESSFTSHWHPLGRSNVPPLHKESREVYNLHISADICIILRRYWCNTRLILRRSFCKMDQKTTR
jgi:hypothetical protein